MSASTLVPATCYYEILGVSPKASAGEIRASFIAKAKTFHPDKRKREVEKLFNPQSEEAHNVPGAGDWDEMFSILSRAYSILGNESSRAQYDLNLLTQQKQQQKQTPGSFSVSGSLKKLRELQKRDAELQTSLMEETYALRRDFEEKKNGLVVIEAWYGPKYAVENPTRFANLVVNVTRQVQVLVDDKSRLIFPAGQAKTKVIPGLYCPPSADEFDPRALKLVYTFKRKLHSILVADEELLLAPLKAHYVALKQIGNKHSGAYQDDAGQMHRATTAGAAVGSELVLCTNDEFVLNAKYQARAQGSSSSTFAKRLLRASTWIGISLIALNLVRRH